MAEPLVSVVILTWNRKDDLLETVRHVKHSSHTNLEIIVVDNGSTDGTAQTVRETHPEIKLIPLDTNTGIAGYNRGFETATGDYVVCIDSDSYPHRMAISRMVKLFEQNQNAGAVAFQVHTPTSTALQSVPETGEVSDSYGYHGAGCGFRREVFEKAGYWYEPFFLYFNEMDHAMRIWQAGYRIITSPAVAAFHKSSTVSRPSSTGGFYYVRNAFWVIWRRYPAGRMWTATFALIKDCIEQCFEQHTLLYAKAMLGAFSGILGAFAGRRPLPSSLAAKFRIPFHLAFSRFQ